ncbi:hypothetical protein KL86PLE_20147 [uncultured Pleomorphomonas sp.]|uniref:Uncharacterized protein n=1 Tax=uncultured Pleomorphomonas sp. TaxID=442121 RepID=A0A212LDQ2_9HYPH|nr:hypothetical protein KL86PLE_20147 [uncultured Pleomorphomonas sp.]
MPCRLKHKSYDRMTSGDPQAAGQPETGGYPCHARRLRATCAQAAKRLQACHTTTDVLA